MSAVPENKFTHLMYMGVVSQDTFDWHLPPKTEMYWKSSAGQAENKAELTFHVRDVWSELGEKNKFQVSEKVGNAMDRTKEISMIG